MPNKGKRKLASAEADPELQGSAQGVVETELIASAAGAGDSGIAYFKALGLGAAYSNKTLFSCMCKLFINKSLHPLYERFAEFRALRVNPQIKHYEASKTDAQPESRGSGEGATCTRLLIGATMTKGRCADSCPTPAHASPSLVSHTTKEILLGRRSPAFPITCGAQVRQHLRARG